MFPAFSKSPEKLEKQASPTRTNEKLHVRKNLLFNGWDEWRENWVTHHRSNNKSVEKGKKLLALYKDRTCDLSVISTALWPTELREHVKRGALN